MMEFESFWNLAWIICILGAGSLAFGALVGLLTSLVLGQTQLGGRSAGIIAATPILIVTGLYWWEINERNLATILALWPVLIGTFVPGCAAAFIVASLAITQLRKL